MAPSPAPGLTGGGGANYGWNCREGLLPGLGDDPQCATLLPRDFTDPVFDYPHDADPDLGGSDRCAIIGGYVARDAALGALFGHYLYTDLCSGVLRALALPAGGSGQASGDCSLGLRLNSPVSFGEDAARRLYLVEQGGRVSRLVGPPPLAAHCRRRGRRGRRRLARPPPSSASAPSGAGSSAAGGRC